MSFLSHNSSNHSHLQRRISKKQGTLHSVTSGEKPLSSDPQRPREFAPLQFDKDAPVPHSTFSGSIFKL